MIIVSAKRLPYLDGKFNVRCETVINVLDDNIAQVDRPPK